MKYQSFVLSGFLFSALLCVEAGSARAAEEAPVVLAKKGHVPSAGVIVTQETTGTLKDAAMTVNAQGQDINGTMNRSVKETETVQLVSPGKVRKVQTVSESNSKVTINGQDQETPDKPKALFNVPYILEQKDGKWVASLESGEEPSAEQKKALEAKAKYRR